MNNSEILYLYDAKLTNPNGDPDEENRPRMDYEREINLVSDLRLKRYVRDYLLGQGYELFVQKVEEKGVEKSVTAETRIKKLESMDNEKILDSLIDVRLFGATMPIKGDNKQFIGPVQFNWGYSLNKVEILESSITSHFASDDKKGQIVLLTGIDNAKFKNRVIPGDQLHIKVKKVAERGPFEKWQAEVYVDEKLCVSALLSAMKTGKKSI